MIMIAPVVVDICDGAIGSVTSMPDHVVCVIATAIAQTVSYSLCGAFAFVDRFHVTLLLLWLVRSLSTLASSRRTPSQTHRTLLCRDTARLEGWSCPLPPVTSRHRH